VQIYSLDGMGKITKDSESRPFSGHDGFTIGDLNDDQYLDIVLADY